MFSNIYIFILNLTYVGIVFIHMYKKYVILKQEIEIVTKLFNKQWAYVWQNLHFYFSTQLT